MNYLEKNFENKKESKKITEMNFKLGDIIVVDFGFNVGSEQNKVRPAVVLKQFEDLITVMPIASKMKKSKTHININEVDTRIPSYVPVEERRHIVGCLILEQIKTVSTKEVKTERPIGLLLEKTRKYLKSVIKKTLGLEGYYNYTEGYNSIEVINNELSIENIDSDIDLKLKERIIKRGEVVEVNFGQTNIDVLNGITKAVVISPNYANKNNKTVIVSPIVKVEKKEERKTLDTKLFYINDTEAIDLSIIRTIDKVRIINAEEEQHKLRDKQELFMDILVENMYNLFVLFEYKQLKGLYSIDKPVVIL